MQWVTPDAQIILAMCIFLLIVLVFVVIVLVIHSRKKAQIAHDLLDALTPFLSERLRSRTRGRMRLGPPDL